ncbi:MAG: TadE/TadG family type IV pilus assembly protein [Rudaea sp.]
MPIRSKQPSRRERGVALVEFAFTFPIVLLLVMGAFDLGWAVYAKNSVSLAAREGARRAIITGNSDDIVRAAAKNASQGLALTDADIVITPSQNGSAPYRQPRTSVTVVVRYAYHPITPVIAPFIPGGSLMIGSSATMIVE